MVFDKELTVSNAQHFVDKEAQAFEEFYNKVQITEPQAKMIAEQLMEQGMNFDYVDSDPGKPIITGELSITKQLSPETLKKYSKDDVGVGSAIQHYTKAQIGQANANLARAKRAGKKLERKQKAQKIKCKSYVEGKTQ